MPIQQRPQAAIQYRSQIEVLAEIVNDGLPLVHVFPYKLSCFSYLLFDIEEIFMDEEGTATQLTLTPKGIGGGKFTLVMTDEECAMQRQEEMHTFEYATVSSDVTATDEVTVNDITLLRGIGPSTKVRFQTGTAPFTTQSPGTKNAVVTAISGNTITLASPITLAAGDRMFRGANLRIRCEDIDNRYTLNKQGTYKSYFQTIQASLKFKTCDLSKDRAKFKITNGTPNLWVNAHINATFEGLLKVEYIDAFLYSENVEEIEGTQASQTSGLVTRLQDAQVATGDNYILDFSALVGTTDDEQVISALVDVFIARFDSGYYADGVITAAVNSVQINHLMQMSSQFYEYFGVQVYKESSETHQGCRDYASLKVLGLDIEHGYIEFVAFEPFNHYFPVTPIMILMPKPMFGMYGRDKSKLDSDLNVMPGDTELTFEWKDISEIVNARSIDECFEYITQLEFAFAQAGIYNGAYAIIKNARSFRVENTGTPSVSSIVVASS